MEEAANRIQRLSALTRMTHRFFPSVVIVSCLRNLASKVSTALGDYAFVKWARLAALARFALREISRRRFRESFLARAAPPRRANAVMVSSFTELLYHACTLR